MKKRNKTLKDQRVSKKSKNVRLGRKNKNNPSEKNIVSANVMRVAVIIFSIFLITVFLKQYAVDLASLGKPSIFLVGNNVVEREKILKTTGIEDASFLFLSPSKVVSELERIPWVKSVSVRKKFPNSIFISIEERKPFAWLDNNGLKLIDDNGVILNPKEEMDSLDMDIIKGFSAGHNYIAGEKVREESLYEAISLLKDIRNFAPWFNERISSMDMSQDDNIVFEMNSYPCRIYLGKDNVHEKMENLKKVFSTIDDSEFINISLFDLRFKDRVVVKTEQEKEGAESMSQT